MPFGQRAEQNTGEGAVDEMVQDPYCKTYIPTKESVKRTINGKVYSFCSDKCASEFDAEMKRK